MLSKRHNIQALLTSTLLVGFAIITPPQARAAQPLVLEKLSAREGLPQGDVFATLQDSQGFVWIGTEDGLVRFDGHELHRYGYSPTVSDGLPGNYVDSIAEDKHGDLWIGIKGSGLACWHRATDTFTVYRHDPADPNSLSSDGVRAVLVDSKGDIWVGTLDGGVNIINPATGHIKTLRHDSAHTDSLADDQIQTLMQDRAGAIWIGTHSGLDRIQEDPVVAHVSLNGQGGTAVSAPISQIVEDSDGSVWVGTFNDGLFHIDRNGIQVSHLRHDGARNGSLSNNDVRAILDDQAGHFWVGTPEGLDLLDRRTNQFVHYSHDKSDPDSLSDSYIMSLYRDAAGLVWIGTRSGGVDRWNPHSWELGGNRPAWLDGKLVTAFADAEDNRIWISSVGGGLVRYDPAGGDAVDIDTVLHEPNALGDKRVMSLHLDRRGALWIGTMANGLKKLADGKIVSIAVGAGDAHAVSAAGIMSIYEAANGYLWIGTHGGGANVLDPASGMVKQLPYNPAIAGAVSAANVTSFIEDRLGNIWIGTDSGGLDLAHADGSVFRTFKHDPKSASSLSANTVYALAMDSAGRIWVATDGGGLDMVEGSSSAPDSIQFKTISHVNGLSSDTIYSVLPDAMGSLWLSGNSGLMRYNPASQSVKTFHREHGLQGEEFNYGAYYRTRDGRLCFGGPGGFNVFDPTRLADSHAAPRIALTHLDVLGAPLQSTTPYWLMNRIELGYRANVVSMDFAALDFASLNRNQVSYRMAGLADEWINLGPLRRITLTNLAAGDHVLEVRAINADSVRSSTPLRLVIHKDAAPWRSSAAYGTYAVVLIALLAMGWQAQRRKWRGALLAQRRLEAEVELRTHELRDINHQLVVAGEAKSRFLARMSHELRTPMNGVLGMAELLDCTPLTPAQKRQTQTIRTSAKTLLQIFNDLLDLSKAQAGKIELEELPVDLVQISEECAALFYGSASAKGIELIVSPPADAPWELFGDPLRIRQILMNLIGNAVKFTERGEIVLDCRVSSAGNSDAAVTLTVTDTGIGMTEAAIRTVFEPFAQADETTTRRFGGTGLGLTICQELVTLMGGSIDVKSAPQIGSTFQVSLRLKGSQSRGTAAPALHASTVRILSRHPSLSEALSRYVSTIAPQCPCTIHDPSDYQAGQPGIVLLDADSCPEILQQLNPADVRGGDARLLVIASQSAIGTHDIEWLVTAGKIILKPLTRETLRNALRAAVRNPTTDSSPQEAHAPRTQKMHLLVVEDEAVNAAVAQGYAKELGCTSVWADNGAAAIARAGIERFDLILMDLNMPGLDGFAATALMRQAERGGARLPIIALTANDAAAYRDTCLLAGMDDILTKPYSIHEFAETLRRWSGGSAIVGQNTVAPTDGAVPSGALISVDLAAVAGLRRLRYAGTSSLYSKLVVLFEKSSADGLSQIHQALSVHDLTAAANGCHKLKGGAANVGATAFADALAELERYCRAGEGETALRLYRSLKAAHPLLVDELAALQASA